MALTNALQVWNAIKRALDGDASGQFGRSQVAELARGVRPSSFPPTFQAMRLEQPGGAPHIRRDLVAVIQRGKFPGTYRLTQKGAALLRREISASGTAQRFGGAPRSPGSRRTQEAPPVPGGSVAAAVADIESVQGDTTITRTDVERLVDARLGQGRFRASVIAVWSRCPATGCDDQRLLVASHIRPWSLSSNAERLDPYNGILLAPNIDRLFDRGLITFDDDGTVRRSRSLSPATADKLGVPKRLAAPFHARHLPFLADHRRRNGFSK